MPGPGTIVSRPTISNGTAAVSEAGSGTSRCHPATSSPRKSSGGAASSPPSTMRRRRIEGSVAEQTGVHAAEADQGENGSQNGVIARMRPRPSAPSPLDRLEQVVDAGEDGSGARALLDEAPEGLVRAGSSTRARAAGGGLRCWGTAAGAQCGRVCRPAHRRGWALRSDTGVRIRARHRRSRRRADAAARSRCRPSSGPAPLSSAVHRTGHVRLAATRLPGSLARARSADSRSVASIPK